MVRIFFFLVCSLLLVTSHAEDRPPNVVVILTDDQGWGDLSLTGNRNLATPNIDSIGLDGARFERFYVAPVCSPTRAEFLTGRYAGRGGVYATSAGGERLDLDEETIADVFQAAGYKTGAFGKWHNGMQYPYHPNGRGFDEFYGFCSGHWGDYFSPMLEHNGRIVEGEGYIVDDCTDKALAFIEENKDGPFFAFLPYNTPHGPMQVPDEYWERFADKELPMKHRDPEKEDDDHLRAALAMCENIDWNVGRVLERLDELDLEDDTIVVYFHDNGPNGWRWNDGLKGKKASTDEGGVKSPLFIRWPEGIEPATEVAIPGAAIDLLPTLADLTGVERRGNLPLDGASLAGLLNEDYEMTFGLAERPLFTAWGKQAAVRALGFLYNNEGLLFNLGEDPGQRIDVAEKHPLVREQLDSELDAWTGEMHGELARLEPRAFLIAHPDHAWTQLPARDAEPRGGVERSNRFPNDSFFENWTSTEDAIVWDAEVVESGRFEAEIFYTCDGENTGSTIELRLGDDALRATVEKAFPTGLVGAEEDRSPRKSSYTQDWGRVSLGEIELREGPGELTLRALEIPGEEVMDFRLLLLRRIGS